MESEDENKINSAFENCHNTNPKPKLPSGDVDCCADFIVDLNTTEKPN